MTRLAVSRAPARPRPVAPTPLEMLARVVAALDEVESRRLAVVAIRDESVRAARAEGHTWATIAAAAQTSPQALMKRDRDSGAVN